MKAQQARERFGSYFDSFSYGDDSIVREVLGTPTNKWEFDNQDDAVVAACSRRIKRLRARLNTLESVVARQGLARLENGIDNVNVEFLQDDLNIAGDLDKGDSVFIVNYNNVLYQPITIEQLQVEHVEIYDNRNCISSDKEKDKYDFVVKYTADGHRFDLMDSIHDKDLEPGEIDINYVNHKMFRTRRQAEQFCDRMVNRIQQNLAQSQINNYC